MQVKEKENEKKFDIPQLSSKQAIKNKKAKKSYCFLVDVESDRTFPAFVLASLIYNVILTFLFGALAIAMVRLSWRPVPTLVQLPDGTTIRVRPAGNLDRTPETIKNFAESIGGLLYNWTKVVPVIDENGNLKRDRAGKILVQPDEGVVVSEPEGLKVTSPVWEASFALSASDNFRSSFLKQTAEVQAKSIWSSDTQVIWEVSQIGEPVLLEPGKWKVAVVATCLYVNGKTATRELTACNKEFYLSAIDTPPIPLPELATPVQVASHRARAASLEIYLIKDF